MMEKLKVIAFTLVVSAVFAAAVSGLNAALKPRIDLNRKVETQKVILELMGIKKEDAALQEAGEALWPLEKINQTFEEKIIAVPPLPETTQEAEAETQAGVYRYFKESDGPRIVFPISGRGFWAMIYGYMAVNPNEKTIQGVAFTKHEETPGLGARIEERSWREKFIGMPYDQVGAEGKRIRVVSEPAADEPEVDVITGASETSRAVETILNESIARFLSERGKETP